MFCYDRLIKTSAFFFLFLFSFQWVAKTTAIKIQVDGKRKSLFEEAWEESHRWTNEFSGVPSPES